MIKEVKLDVVGKFHLVHEIAWFLRMNLGMPGIPCPEHMLNVKDVADKFLHKHKVFL